MANVKVYDEINIKNFEEVFKVSELTNNYVFRGQANQDWSLQSTFERVRTGVDSTGWMELEQKVMLEFKRRAHHYISDLPKKNRLLEWLALMQHHGCPTRLLDFTRSFFVALFFAIEEADSDCAVWAINSFAYNDWEFPTWKEYVYSKYNKISEKEADQILSYPEKDKLKSGVLFVEPYRMNQRLSIQQGLFLFPKNIKVSFEENLCEPLGAKKLYELNTEEGVNQSIIKIVIPQNIHLQISYWLSTVNITAATLFPGLDGYARSQITHIKYAKYNEQIMREALKTTFGSDYKKMISLAMDGISESAGRTPQKEK